MDRWLAKALHCRWRSSPHNYGGKHHRVTLMLPPLPNALAFLGLS